MAVKDGLPATDFSRMNRKYIRDIAEGETVPDGLPATDFSRMNREYIKAVVEESGGGGGEITVESLSVTENGTYTADEGKAYSPVSVSVPQTTIESLSVTENGTYTAPEGKAYSPITVNVSGAGAFALLNTITIDQAVNAIKIDIDPAWNVYDMIYIEVDATFSGNDYLYYDFDTETPTHYLNSAIPHWFIADMTKTDGTWTKTIQTYNGHYSSSGFPTYLYMKAYTESKNFTTATKITIHGGKLS